MDDRYLAYKTLFRIEKDKAYSNLTLDSMLESEGDGVYSKRFVSALVYGVLERMITIDYILSSYLKQPLKKLRPEVLTVLRMGVCQLKFMDSVPDSAAVNESVKLVKKVGCQYASGLVNSVLRKISAIDTDYPETDDVSYNLSIRYSCPQALVKQFCDDYGVENAEGILKCSLGNSPITARVNTLLTDTDSLIETLKASGVEAQQSEQLENYIVLKNTGSIQENEAYKNGLFHIQDISSGMCANAVNAREGMTVIDVCSAPGGKTFSIAENMNNKGKIYAFDLYENRVGLIKDGAKRLKIDIIEAKAHNAAEFIPELEGVADRVLCDVPCSCLGTLSRKPEIKYKDFGLIDKLCELQYNILSNSARYLKADGLLVYSTCSLSKRENEGVCDRFLNDNPDFEKAADYRTFLPHIDNTDGFFIAVLRRRND